MFVTRRPIGRMAALLGTWCGATGPQEPAEPVRVDRRQSRPGIGYSARQTAATGICGVSRIRAVRRGFTFPLLTGRYCGAGRWPTRGVALPQTHGESYSRQLETSYCDLLY